MKGQLLKNTRAPRQLKAVVEFMLAAGSITVREAMIDVKVQSLTSVINQLRKRGIEVESEWKHHPTTNQRYTRYHLSDRAKARSFLNSHS